jgi:hypothetical protein
VLQSIASVIQARRRSPVEAMVGPILQRLGAALGGGESGFSSLPSVYILGEDKGLIETLYCGLASSSSLAIVLEREAWREVD